MAGLAPNEVNDDAVTPLASVVPVRFAAGAAFAVMEVLQAKPVFKAYWSAVVALEQPEGIARAVGEAVPDVAFPTMVLAACVARSVSVTRPVAVREVVTVSPEMDGEVERTTFPGVPVTGRLPSTPPLSYKMKPVVPRETVVTPMLIVPAAAVIVHVDARVQFTPLT
jgi:hypothetical protein